MKDTWINLKKTNGRLQASRLAHWRQAAGLKQTELAEKCNTTQQRISSYENLDRPVDIELLREFVYILNKSLEQKITLADLINTHEHVK